MIHRRPRTRSLRHALVALALLGFACRALVPAGFMPAPIAEGGPITVCHGGAAGAFWRAFAESRAAAEASASHSDAAQHASHDHHGADASLDAAGAEPEADGSGAHGAWDHCPIGAVFSAAAVSADPSLKLPVLEHVFERTEPAVLRGSSFSGVYDARAPPAA